MTTRAHPIKFNSRIAIFIGICLLTACRPSTDQKVAVDLLTLDANRGRMLLAEKPFTGQAVDYFPNGINSVAIDYRAGKKHGSYKKWFDNGQLSFQSQYVDGKKDGLTLSWWSNGKLRSESHFEKGIANGFQKQWYQSGAKFKHIHLVAGQEQGLQQSWRENGKIYNNYEAKNGRIFGLKRANLCYELDDEVIQLAGD